MPPPSPAFHFNNSYQQLPEHFYTRIAPVPVVNPQLIVFNHGLAEELGLDPILLEPQAHLLFSGNLLPEDAQPIAMAYAGHQFGHFVPLLGDGRAILLGEIFDRRSRRRDIHLKGTGQTPYSRQGDGRAWLGPVLREYLVSESMHALGIPTTRALAAVTTGEVVIREKAFPGAVLTRVAASHIRIGTFQYFASRGDYKAVRLLADHVIGRHFPEIDLEEDRYLALLEAVIDRQAFLVARWVLVGFIHGVMNTDNMAVSGETIDYGPCAFMDSYDPATVFSSIDHWGRYAFGKQPDIAAWNLARLAETLLPIMGLDNKVALEQSTAVLHEFPNRFTQYWLDGMRAKLGLGSSASEDIVLIQDLFSTMQKGRADFTMTFRQLGEAVVAPDTDATLRRLFSNPDDFDAWSVRWRARLQRDAMNDDARYASMRSTNPVYIPRNHLVETALESAYRQGDFEPFKKLLAVLSRPWEDQLGMEEYATPPPPSQQVFQTFCGT